MHVRRHHTRAIISSQAQSPKRCSHLLSVSHVIPSYQNHKRMSCPRRYSRHPQTHMQLSSVPCGFKKCNGATMHRTPVITMSNTYSQFEGMRLLCVACVTASIGKELDTAMMTEYTRSSDSKSSLRAPHLHETIHADKYILSKIFSLAREPELDVDNTIHSL